jgi:hypothetical protein
MPGHSAVLADEDIPRAEARLLCVEPAARGLHAVCLLARGRGLELCLARGLGDAACTVSTRGGTRLVWLVRGRGGP